MQLGDLTLTPLSDGAFRLDGGAMFGVVPKPLWERRTRPDERNRIPLGLRPLLVRTPDHVVLIDAGRLVFQGVPGDLAAAAGADAGDGDSAAERGYSAILRRHREGGAA